MMRQDEAEAMTLMNQEMVYNSVGQKIKADLYDGNAVVLFAYGLSGSGKTFTVFGPDAVDIPEVCLVEPSSSETSRLGIDVAVWFGEFCGGGKVREKTGTFCMST